MDGSHTGRPDLQAEWKLRMDGSHTGRPDLQAEWNNFTKMTSADTKSLTGDVSSVSYPGQDAGKTTKVSVGEYGTSEYGSSVTPMDFSNPTAAEISAKAETSRIADDGTYLPYVASSSSDSDEVEMGQKEKKGNSISDKTGAEKSSTSSPSHRKSKSRSRSYSHSSASSRSPSPTKHKDDATSEPAASTDLNKADPSLKDSNSSSKPPSKSRSRSRSHDNRRHRRRSRDRHHRSRSRSPRRRRSRDRRHRRRHGSRDRHHRRRRHSSRSPHRRRSRSPHRRRSRSPERDPYKRNYSRDRDRPWRSRSRDRRGFRYNGSKPEPKKLTYKEHLKQSLIQAQKELQKTGNITMEEHKELMTSNEVPSKLPIYEDPMLAVTHGAELDPRVTPQLAFIHSMQAMHKKAQQLTGVAVPKYYNPAAVNPLKYAEQVQKRKLLWSKNKEEKTEEKPAPASWSAAARAIETDNDEKTSEKFKKLMGIKHLPETDAPMDEGAEKAKQKQKDLFNQLDKDYEMARLATHTHRGIGLGYTSYYSSMMQPSSAPQPATSSTKPAEPQAPEKASVNMSV